MREDQLFIAAAFQISFYGWEYYVMQHTSWQICQKWFSLCNDHIWDVRLATQEVVQNFSALPFLP